MRLFTTMACRVFARPTAAGLTGGMTGGVELVGGARVARTGWEDSGWGRSVV